MMEKTVIENIKFLRDWIAKNGTTEKLERLLYLMEHKNELQLDLIPDEIFHDLCGSNVEAIPLDMVPKYQKKYPDYKWDDLSRRGEIIINPLLH